MTLHASKGLEFHTVFLIEANEGLNSLSESRERAECRRRAQAVLCGNDPAKDVLKITYVKIKNGKEISPSRFVEELFEGV